MAHQAVHSEAKFKCEMCEKVKISVVCKCPKLNNIFITVGLQKKERSS